MGATARGPRGCVGGHFSAISQIKRDQLGSVSVSTGATTPWAPVLTGTYMGVWPIAATENKLLVGGDFKWVAGRPQARFACFTGAP